MGKTRRKYRKKRKSRKRSRGGVGTAGQAAALSQVFKHLTQRNEHSGLPGEILSHQSFEDRDNVERKQQRRQARLDLDNRQQEINSQHHENQSAIRDALASTTGLAEPRLIENIQHYARPHHPLQQQIRQRGQQNTDAIQAEIDHHHWVRTRNREDTIPTAKQVATPTSSPKSQRSPKVLMTSLRLFCLHWKGRQERRPTLRTACVS